MTSETKVTIYYGPLNWFHEQLGDRKRRSLIELVYEADELARQHTHVIQGQEEAPPAVRTRRPKLVVSESSDYASLNEHAVSNFVGLVRTLRPKRLWLQNPPARIQEQLQRAFPDTNVVQFEYPLVTAETLKRFQAGFSQHLVGQAAVNDLVLAALYPLTQAGRTEPVVLMFYGPSGVGKTETAQFVNSLLSGELFRKQFSMFHSEKFASYLFGGSHSEPSLAHDLLDRESGVILIDEFDKANSVFHSAFYQLFDGGLFEDKNYRVEIGPSLIICTSNYASDQEVRDALGDALYSRFDGVIRFEHLSPAEVVAVIERIVDDRLGKLTESELSCLDRNELLGNLAPLANQSANVRRLGKTINQLISILLVRSLLDEGASPADEPLAAEVEAFS